MRPLGIPHVHQYISHVVALFFEQQQGILQGIQHMARRTVGIQVGLRLFYAVDGFRHSETVVVGAYHDIVFFRRDDISFNRISDDAFFIGGGCLVPSHHRGMVQQDDACRRLLPVIDVIRHEDGRAHRDAVTWMQGGHRTVVKRQSSHPRTVKVRLILHDTGQFRLLSPGRSRQGQQHCNDCQYALAHLFKRFDGLPPPSWAPPPVIRIGRRSCLAGRFCSACMPATLASSPALSASVHIPIR